MSSNSFVGRPTTDVILALEANHTTKTLSHGINYSKLLLLQQMPAPGGRGKGSQDWCLTRVFIPFPEPPPALADGQVLQHKNPETSRT